jgi:hypothetical protein
LNSTVSMLQQTDSARNKQYFIGLKKGYVLDKLERCKKLRYVREDDRGVAAEVNKSTTLFRHHVMFGSEQVFAFCLLLVSNV